MIKGHILDSYADFKKNVMVTWLIYNGTPHRIEDRFEPSFYVHSSSKDLFKLASELQDVPQVKYLNFTRHRVSLDFKQKLVLEVTPRTLSSFKKMASMIDTWGKYRTYELYNVDIRLPTRYLQYKGVFSNAYVKWDGIQFVLLDSQWAIDYDFPKFRALHFNIERKTGFQSLSKPITAISINGEEIKEENEADTIRTALQYIHRKDPDIIYTIEGDSFLLPYIYHRAKECNIGNEVNFGRDPTQRQRPVKKAKSYFSYGQIVYRPAFYTFQGRIHIDRHSSFLYGESGLWGLVDISRCANIPLQLQSRLGPGTAISQIQINKAMQKGYLIPWKKNMPENCKTARQLLLSDRGGHILSPVVGLHDAVVELDFASLYPNIMLNYNISPETMLCECCYDSHIIVPQLGYHICYRNKGLLPEVLKPILFRRFCFKARAKNKTYDPAICKEIQQAWKWILIVCFGYTGYRNARFGRIECHESITAFARDILLHAVELAEQTGYRVLHGIIDSLWVKATKKDADPFKLSRMISKKIGIKIDVEGQYKWIVFLPSKQFDVGALNRYYGLFTTNELKVRGIELRQRNTPVFLREVQKRMLTVLKKAHTSQEVYQHIPHAVETLLECGTHIIDGIQDVHTLVFKNRISRYVPDYKVNNLVKASLLQLRDRGIQVEPGQYVQYIVTNERARNHAHRVSVVESLTGDEQIDVDYYLRQIAKCGESLLIPFGHTLENLYARLHQLKYKENRNGTILQRVRTNQTCI
jgi:DNA polymerase elongation subunit (family B)